jgi:hypothetical protein
LLGRLIRRIDQRWYAPKFAQRLAPRLLRDYGASKFYTPGQIRTACAKCRLPRRHLALAYAAFLPQTEFEAATDETMWPDYMALRVLFFRFIAGGKDFSVAPASMDAWWGGVDHPESHGSPD